MSKIDKLSKNKVETKQPVEMLFDEKEDKRTEDQEIIVSSNADLIIKKIGNELINNELINEYGKSFNDIKIELNKLYEDTMKDIKQNVSSYYLKNAIEDLNMIFNNIIFKYTSFISTTSFENFTNILYRVEKILGTESDFYSKDIDYRNEKFNNEINKFIPNRYIKFYSYLLTQEITSSFGMYDQIIKEIKAQDFVLNKDFLNIQYKQGEFFIIRFPDYISKVNARIIDHISTNYIYEKGDKFNSNNALKDCEENGFRIELTHKSLNTEDSNIIFIRKNIHGFKPITDENYFIDLFSNFDLSTEKKNEYINKIKEVATGEASYFIVGKTGSGKTTLLRQLILLNEREQNRITIEDTPELFLPDTISYQSNKIYSIHDIFVSTLRMNPSSVIVGETRDRTILDILELSLTANSASTLHASDMRKCLCRLKLMVNGEVEPKFLEELVCSTINMFIFMQNRKITELYFRNNKEYNGNFYECYDKMV